MVTLIVAALGTQDVPVDELDVFAGFGKATAHFDVCSVC
jgi:hypothetical protein